MKSLSIKQLVIYGLLSCGVIIAVTYLIDFMAIDSCLDDGGSFNYKIMECDLTSNHEKMSYFEARKIRFLLYLVGTSTFILFSVISKLSSSRNNNGN